MEGIVSQKGILAFFAAALLISLVAQGPVNAEELEQEFVTTSPVVADGVLYVASSTYPGYRGHLRGIDLSNFFPVTLWDAAERVPLAGTGTPPEFINLANQTRFLFTNVDDVLVSLAASSAESLQARLDVETLAEVEVLLHALRGRVGGIPERPAGTGEDPQRLWSISRSSPLLVDRSLHNPVALYRDRVLYVGADDGLLHTFFVSRWDQDSGAYRADDPDGGVELWGYLPGSFLPYLKDQPLLDGVDPLVIQMDGSPLSREVFVDLDGDGLRHWHTFLIATGTIAPARRSSLFVLDVTDPYRPQLLWEMLLPGSGTGRTRGVNIGNCAGSSAQCLYLAADSVVEDEAAMHVVAMTLAEGALVWQFTAASPVNGPVASATPAVPVLADLDGDKTDDALVIGDLVGRLWALDLASGQARGGEPVFMAPGGEAEPIGAGVAVVGNLVVFGTGGVEEADNTYQYCIYAVEILPEGARLRWSYPLSPGEKVWQAPTVDAEGNLIFATSRDYLSLARSGERPTSGRVVSLNGSGEETASRETDAATIGRVVAAQGFAVTVDLTGDVSQFGTASRLTGPAGERGSVKILSWRQR